MFYVEVLNNEVYFGSISFEKYHVRRNENGEKL